MNLKPHYGLTKDLKGTHSFLSPSSPAWINYEEDKLDRVYFASQAARRGTELHDLAHNAIRLGVKLADTKTTLNMYVNDAIGYNMTSEQLLFYSENCYGHADTIGFRFNTLRLHDLKTGVNQAGMTQLEIYTGLFCLEYEMNPQDFAMELRIYQNDTVVVHSPDPADILRIMDKIKFFDKRIDWLKKGGMS